MVETRRDWLGAPSRASGNAVDRVGMDQLECILISRRIWCCDRCDERVMVPTGLRPFAVVCACHGGPAYVRVHTGIKFVQTNQDRWVAIF